MKSSLKLFLIVLISTFIVSCSISNKPDVVFEKHDTAKGATYVSLPPSLARKYVSSEMQNDKELREVLEEIKTFKALIIQKDEAEIDIEAEILQPIKSYAREKKMQDLVRFSQHGNEIMVKAHDKEGMVDELLISINNQEIFGGVYLEGNITLQNILKVLKNMDYNQLESFIKTQND